MLVMRTNAEQEKVWISVLATLLNSEIPVINLKNISGEFGGYAIHFRQALKITVNIFSILILVNLIIFMNSSDYPCLNKLCFHLSLSPFHSLVLIKGWLSERTHEGKEKGCLMIV